MAPGDGVLVELDAKCGRPSFGLCRCDECKVLLSVSTREIMRHQACVTCTFTYEVTGHTLLMRLQQSSANCYSSLVGLVLALGMGRASQLFENGSDRKELSSFQEKEYLRFTCQPK
jgi:hypothetical protein